MGAVLLATLLTTVALAAVPANLGDYHDAMQFEAERLGLRAEREAYEQQLKTLGETYRSYREMRIKGSISREEFSKIEREYFYTKNKVKELERFEKVREVERDLNLDRAHGGSGTMYQLKIAKTYANLWEAKYHLGEARVALSEVQLDYHQENYHRSRRLHRGLAEPRLTVFEQQRHLESALGSKKAEKAKMDQAKKAWDDYLEVVQHLELAAKELKPPAPPTSTAAKR